MKRRGLSTVVGAVFFVLVMASAIGYVTYSLGLIDDLARQVDVKQDTTSNRQNEEFIISKVSIDNNEFNLTVTNTGNIPINITRMWAKNMTDPSWNQTKHQINKFISPGGSVSDIGQGTGLVAMDSKSYLLKLVTSRGNSLDTQLLSAASQPLDMKLYVTPSSPISTSDVTLLYTVRNNLTAGKIIQNLTPILANPAGAATANFVSGPTPASFSSLSPGEMAFFEWTYNIVGNDAQQVTFNATLANAVSGNNATDTLAIIVPPVSQSSINEVLGGSVGILSMNFTSFEFCDYEAVNCETDTTNWVRAWNGTTNTEYIWRINMTNNGLVDIFLEEKTALLILRAQSVGGGGIARVMFIMNDSTDSQEDGHLYTDHSKALKVGISQVVYFGEDKAGGSHTHEATHDDETIYAVNLLIFGHDDTDGSGGYTLADVAYSQNLPFQAFSLADPP